jgi:hypothetical protein
MYDQELFTLMQSWGYYLEPKAHTFSPGYAGISVAVRATPTHRHYDPETITLFLLNQGDVERTQLGIRSRSTMVRCVCPGRVTLRDRHQKRTDFYTYGAKLSTVSGQNETIFRFVSNAPVLWLGEAGDSFPMHLDAQTEAILAGIHTQWRRQDDLFARRLAEVEPMDLYLATLRSIEERYVRYPVLQVSFNYFYGRLRREILWQQATGHFQVDGPRLETLLPAPNGFI